MKNKNLKQKRTAAFVLLLTLAGMTNAFAQKFTVGDLDYIIIDDGNSAKVCDCSSLARNIEIPEAVPYNGVTYSVTTITWDAFVNKKMTSVIIPKSVISIEANPFWGCLNLEKIIVDSGNTTYDSRENCNAIIEKSTNILITGCKNTFIPNSVTTIGKRAFLHCRGLNSITIPNSGYCPKKCVCTLTRKKRIGRCRPIPKVCNFRVPKL